ncbi:MAG: hypothetical protein WB626_03435, partial [Bacteroidota bacterium]
MLSASGFFSIRALRRLHRIWKNSPAMYRELAPDEQRDVFFVLPTKNREFMKCLYLSMAFFLAGMA